MCPGTCAHECLVGRVSACARLAELLGLRNLRISHPAKPGINTKHGGINILTSVISASPVCEATHPLFGHVS